MSDAQYKTTISGKVYESHDFQWHTKTPQAPRVNSLQDPGLAKKMAPRVLRLVGISRVDGEEQQDPWRGEWPRHEVEDGPTQL